MLRLAYLGVTNVFALLRLLPGSGRTPRPDIGELTAAYQA
jgi:hypothetical protein